jgi:DnaJ like chaperone protein
LSRFWGDCGCSFHPFGFVEKSSSRLRFVEPERRRYDDGMSFWRSLADKAARAFDLEAEPAMAGAALAHAPCAPDPGDIGFTAAVIGLAAKMARADGLATPEELRAAAAVFRPPAGDEAAFARFYGIAKESLHGFENYARRIGKRYRDRPCLLEDVLDGLFHIAGADGVVTRSELAYLSAVAKLLGVSDEEYRRIRAINMGPDREDPYALLGLVRGADFETVRAEWRRLVAENHPDRVAARGAPPEVVRIAHEKVAALNAAFGAIRAQQA